MLRAAAQRTSIAALQFSAVVILTFVATALMPGDAATTLAGVDSSVNTDAIRRELGLDRPVGERLWAWLTAASHGDLGTSLRNGQPVAAMVTAALPYTITLTALATLLTIVASVPIAALAARYEGRLLDRVITTTCMALHALPGFVLMMLAIAVVSLWLPILPPTALGRELWHEPTLWLLPAAVLAVSPTASQVRILRAGFVDALRSGYCRHATRCGVTPTRLLVRHALPNAIPAATQNLVRIVDYLLGGALIVEALYAMPGLGTILVDAVRTRDVPLIQAAVVLAAIITLTLNVAGDLIARRFSPNQAALR